MSTPNSKLSRGRNKSGSVKEISSSGVQNPAPTGEGRDSDGSDDLFPPGQPSPKAFPESPVKGEAGIEGAPDESILVSDSTVKAHVQGIISHINSFIFKLASLETKSKLVKDCLAGKCKTPEEWTTTRALPVLPSGISYSFATVLEINHLQSEFDKGWLAKLLKDISKNLIPRLQAKIQSLYDEVIDEFIKDIEAGPVRTMMIELFKVEFNKKMNDRARAYTDGQRNTAATAKKRKFQLEKPVKRNHRNERRFNPLQQRPPKHDYKDSRNQYNSAGWSHNRRY